LERWTDVHRRHRQRGAVFLGGKYLFFASAAGTADSLDMLMPDGTTYQAVGTSTTLTTSPGAAPVDLPPAGIGLPLSP
jgi:hypothetical protein